MTKGTQRPKDAAGNRISRQLSHRLRTAGPKARRDDREAPPRVARHLSPATCESHPPKKKKKKYRHLAAARYFECKISRTCRGDKIRMPLNVLSTSRSSSPVTIRSARPATAVARTISSSGSRQMRFGSATGLTISQRSENAEMASTAAGVSNRFCRKARTSSSCKGVDHTIAQRSTVSSISSSQKPRTVNAAKRTFVSNRTLTKPS